MSENLRARQRRLKESNVETPQQNTVQFIRGSGVWLWDAAGRKYLDCDSNLAHVGHCHPKVIEALALQTATLNTDAGYSHQTILDSIEALTAKFDHDLTRAIMVHSRSEANDIALRMAQAMTGKTGIIAVEDADHGNTSATSQLSGNPPLAGRRAANIRLIPAPDARHLVGGSNQEQAAKFAHSLALAVVDLEETGFGFAGLMLCPIFARQGLPDLPAGFLEPAMAIVRRARALVLCDEVQSGLGRVGSDLWGHERIGFAPDVVTVGRSSGNGYPAAAVVTRSEIMTEFHQASGSLDRSAGDPVAAAVAMAVLKIIDDEGLLTNARDVGAHLKTRLKALQHPLIAGVRGQGLFVVIEFLNGDQPAGDFVTGLVIAMREAGILLGQTGRHGNILRLRPPLPFSRDNADIVVDTLARLLKHPK